MVDASKFTYDEMLTDEEKAKAKAAEAEVIGRMTVERQIRSDSPVFRAPPPSETELRLIEIERKLNAIMDHLGIPR